MAALRSIPSSGTSSSSSMAMDFDPPDPNLVSCSCPAFDMAFHPSRNFLAVGLVSGHVELHEYYPEAIVAPSEDHPSTLSSLSDAHTGDAQNPSLRLSIQHHTKSCRSICFDTSGSALYTGSSDLSICAIDTVGKISWRVTDAHNSPVNCMKQGPPCVFVSGDDDGVLKVWDVRQGQKPALSLDCHQDFVSEVAFNEGYTRAISAGGDGTICAINLRQGKIQKKSELLEDEQLSIAIMKGGKKVVTGTQTGVLNIWTWGQWSDISDRFPGHPQSVQSILKLDENRLLTGSSDGIIRVVNIHPNKLLGMVGEHEEDFPIEKLCITEDRRVISSISHDNCVRLWSVAHLAQGSDVAESSSLQAGADGSTKEQLGDMDEDSDAEFESSSADPPPRPSFKRKAGGDANAGFFDDL